MRPTAISTMIAFMSNQLIFAVPQVLYCTLYLLPTCELTICSTPASIAMDRTDRSGDDNTFPINETLKSFVYLVTWLSSNYTSLDSCCGGDNYPDRGGYAISALWHVQNGTSLYELQRLGGWSSYATVQRYSHLNSEQLQEAAERVPGTNWYIALKKWEARSLAG